MCRCGRPALKRRTRCSRCHHSLNGEDPRPGRQTPAERFEAGLDRDSVAGCWLWTGHRFPDGYVKFWADGRYHMVHHWSWARTNGPLAPGQRLYNTCSRRHCMNPAHWFAGSPALAHARKGLTINPEHERLADAA